MVGRRSFVVLSVVVGALAGGGVLARPVDTQCFPRDATVTGTLKGDFFVGFVHRKDVAERRHPTSPTLHFKGTVLSGPDAFQFGRTTLGGFYVYNRSAFFMEGGSVNGFVSAKNRSRITMTGGLIQGNLRVEDSARATVSGGTIAVALLVGKTGAVTIKGGHVSDPFVFDRGTLTLLGGKVDGTWQFKDNAAVTWRGGGVPETVVVSDGASLTVVGTGLTKAPVGTPAQSGMFGEYTLSGRLSDGTVLKGVRLQVENGNKATVRLVEQRSR